MLIQRFSRGGQNSWVYVWLFLCYIWCIFLCRGWVRWEHSCFCIFFDILLHVLACSLWIQVNLIRKATCLESFNQSEKLTPTCGITPPNRTVIVSKAFFHYDSGSIFPLFSYFLSVMQATKMQGWDPRWRYTVTIVMTQFGETEKEKHNPKFCRLWEILMTWHSLISR